MYYDKVQKNKITQQPWFLGVFALVIFAFMVWGNWHQAGTPDEVATGLAALLHTKTGIIAVAAVTSLVLTLVINIVGRLPMQAQTIVVWLALLSGALYFFYSFDLSYTFILSKLPFLITQGVVTTVYISAISIAIAFVLAIVGAIAKLSQNGFAVAIASFYTSFFRGVPLLIQIYLIYLGIPQLGYVIDAVPAGVLALSLCYGAYMTEIFRGGIMSIPRGQWEAARALGLRPFTTMRKVIMPQAMKLIIPPTGNQFIAMLKDSSLVSVIGVWELMFLARTQGREEFRHLEMLITAALLYWFLSIILERCQAVLEKRMKRQER
ncbi:amino acid ABC transporter permease [Bacillus subtilis]|uniref:amino acid ABC transporter permease n=1 Tax=Pseudochrobactrum asaccharolyticum TaxID=354351 RepID=UPI001F2F14D9|nr:amino acid ABC transporter permease [Pseudochrobactrum asaccharolyticum]MCF7647369.1 amino acid ABC transporter permease [Pseudochrobactrum asaccharolyticum]MCF7673176.1 amino acid ABC transporter permease [Bacillus subtilis]